MYALQLATVRVQTLTFVWRQGAFKEWLAALDTSNTNISHGRRHPTSIVAATVHVTAASTLLDEMTRTGEEITQSQLLGLLAFCVDRY